jgi:hypothetical protein
MSVNTLESERNNQGTGCELKVLNRTTVEFRTVSEGWNNPKASDSIPPTYGGNLESTYSNQSSRFKNEINRYARKKDSLQLLVHPF